MGKDEFLSSLEEIITDQLFLTESTDLLNEEIAENCHCIGLSSKLAKQVQGTNLMEVLQKVRANRTLQLKASSISTHLIYYSWFDEQAAQLRFNLINGNHKALPFGAEIQLIEDESYIVDAFLTSSHHEGISWEDLKDVDLASVEKETSKPEYRLKVYTQLLKT